MDLDAGYSQVGGVRIGRGFFALNATWPFATIFVASTGLSIKSVVRDLSFPRHVILGLDVHPGLLSTGLRIRHAAIEYPDVVIFWTFNIDALQKELVQRGYTVVK